MKIERFAYAEDGTFGSVVVGGYRVYTVECPWLENRVGLSCIPEGVYRCVPTFYERGEYEEALAAATSMGMPHFFWDPMMRAAAAGQMGRSAEARAATRKLEQLLPGTARRVREEAAKFIVPEKLREHFLEGLAKAGIAIAGGG